MPCQRCGKSTGPNINKSYQRRDMLTGPNINKTCQRRGGVAVPNVNKTSQRRRTDRATRTTFTQFSLPHSELQTYFLTEIIKVPFTMYSKRKMSVDEDSETCEDSDNIINNDFRGFLDSNSDSDSDILPIIRKRYIL